MAAPCRAPVRKTRSPIEWLYSRKDADGKPLISRAEFEAGVRLSNDYELMHIGALATSDLTRPPGRPKHRGPSHGLTPAERGYEARRRFEAAMAAVGEDLADLIFCVCCENLGLAEAEARFRLPKRSGKEWLKMGLVRLAAHYGFMAPPRSRVSAWIAAGCKPGGLPVADEA